MISALLSFLGSGLLRLLPEVFSFFKQAKDADHEFRMAQLQLEIDKARATQQLDLAHVNAEIALNQSEAVGLIEALKSQGQSTGIKFVDALNALVRPILTYYWCIILYTVWKATIIYQAIESKVPFTQMAPFIMTEFDLNVVSSIIGFWFVDRAIRKSKGQ